MSSEEQYHELAAGYEPIPYDFFERAFWEASEQPFHQKTIRGPYAEHYETLFSMIPSRLAAIHPALQPDALFPSAYQSEETKRQLADVLTAAHTPKLNLLRREHLCTLRDLAGAIAPEQVSQTIPAGTLDIPPYYSQHGSEITDASRGCTAANFQMLFSGITGLPVAEQAVLRAVRLVHGTGAHHDEDYLALFQTRSFQALGKAHVRSLGILGASLETVRERAEWFRDRIPDTRIYCMVSYASRNNRSPIGTWHNGILLEADEHTVTLHDPSNAEAGPYTSIPKQDFLHAWGAAYFRATLVIGQSLEH